ncbi:MAG: hypothetical protein ABEI52_05610 [Halobacteriaceae archaeon]
MAQAGPRESGSKHDAEEEPSVSVDAWLQEVSKQLALAECEDLSELGIYSIHDHNSARTITLPESADGFEDTTTVKQYYFESEECPLLVVAPVKI